VEDRTDAGRLIAVTATVDVKFSVVIPAYNAAGTLRDTLDSVLGQSVSPHEVLVLDDGSTDATPDILAEYAHDARVRAFRRPNGGLAAARNFLIGHATGDQVACVDADDLWHPRFLEAHQRMIADHPEAVGCFTHHVDFVGSAAPEWDPDGGMEPGARGRLIGPRDFIKVYNTTPLTFQVSCFSVPMAVLREMGDEPFYVPGSGADDTYIHHRLTLFGPVVATDERLGAYRLRVGSISSDQLRMALLVLRSFEGLAPLFAAGSDPDLARDFLAAWASRQRNCGKYLMGAGRVAEARAQFRASLRTCRTPRSVAKSLALVAFSLAPARLQPRWPGLERRLPAAHVADVGTAR
jgi:glycosyltransferase involved in cell wall biosynthesis